MKTHPILLRAKRPQLPVLLAAVAAVASLGCGVASAEKSEAPAVTEEAPKEAAPQEPQPPKVGEAAPDFELEDLQGGRVRLSALAARGPVVLVVLRGFPGYQCPLCTAQFGELLGKSEAFKKAGASVLLVYPGPSEGLKAHADEFRRGKEIPANFFLALDPDFTFTRQYGLRWEAKNETAYPSTFVMDTARQVLYAKVSRTHGDRAPIADVVAALPAK
jgi:peroxiredoxin